MIQLIFVPVFVNERVGREVRHGFADVGARPVPRGFEVEDLCGKRVVSDFSFEDDHQPVDHGVQSINVLVLRRDSTVVCVNVCSEDLLQKGEVMCIECETVACYCVLDRQQRARRNIRRYHVEVEQSIRTFVDDFERTENYGRPGKYICCGSIVHGVDAQRPNVTAILVVHQPITDAALCC